MTHDEEVYKMTLIHNIYGMAEWIGSDYNFDELWGFDIETLEKIRSELIPIYNEKVKK